MGGKLEGNNNATGAEGGATSLDQDDKSNGSFLGMQGFKTDGGFTINNNYNNNTISIIDGNTITTNTSQENVASNASKKVGSGLVGAAEINEINGKIAATFVSPTSKGTTGPTGEGVGLDNANLSKDRSGMLPRLAQAQKPTAAAAGLSSGSQNSRPNQAADPSHALNPLDMTEPNANVNMSLLATGEPHQRA